MSLFVIDNSDSVDLLEIEVLKEDTDEQEFSLIRVVGEFDTVEEAEQYASDHDLEIFGEAQCWFV